MANLTLSPDNYRAFQVEGSVPDGTVSLSAWIWSGLGGRIVVDDLSLQLLDPVALVADLSEVGARTAEVGSLNLEGQVETAQLDASLLGGSETGNAATRRNLQPLAPSSAMKTAHHDLPGHTAYPALLTTRSSATSGSSLRDRRSGRSGREEVIDPYELMVRESRRAQDPFRLTPKTRRR